VVPFQRGHDGGGGRANRGATRRQGDSGGGALGVLLARKKGARGEKTWAGGDQRLLTVGGGAMWRG
jgi:hypothetical protein